MDSNIKGLLSPDEYERMRKLADEKQMTDEQFFAYSVREMTKNTEQLLDKTINPRHKLKVVK